MILKNNIRLKLKSIPMLMLGLYASSAFSLEPFVVKDIRVEGIQRTEAGTVFSYLPVKVGEEMDDEKATQAIKSLYLSLIHISEPTRPS